MYPRYRLTVRYGNVFIFDKLFPSITQLVKTSMFFSVEDNNVYLQAIDDLTGRIFSHSNLVMLGKEFSNDQVLF